MMPEHNPDPTPATIIASLRARLDAVSDLADHLAGNEAAPLIREALNGYVPTGDLDPTPATGADQGGALTEGACVCHGSDRPHAPHRPCDMGCQPDWHKDGCAIYLPVPPADQGGALTEAEREQVEIAAGSVLPDGHDLFAAVERIVAAQLADEWERIAGAIEAELGSAEDFQRTRARIKATYSSAIESGLLLGSVDAEEALTTRIRTALARIAREGGQR